MAFITAAKALEPRHGAAVLLEVLQSEGVDVENAGGLAGRAGPTCRCAADIASAVEAGIASGLPNLVELPIGE